MQPNIWEAEAKGSKVKVILDASHSEHETNLGYTSTYFKTNKTKPPEKCLLTTPPVPGIVPISFSPISL